MIVTGVRRSHMVSPRFGRRGGVRRRYQFAPGIVRRREVWLERVEEPKAQSNRPLQKVAPEKVSA